MSDVAEPVTRASATVTAEYQSADNKQDGIELSGQEARERCAMDR
jgi:hypothetical protein